MAQLDAGSVIEGRWELGARRGRGGMGTVYEAFDRLRERAVALKLLRLRTEVSQTAFRREFSLLASAPHAHLARPYDFVRTQSGLCFYTAELIDGLPLDAFADGVAFERLAAALADALEALGWLHRAGIRHGDFKPANVLVDRDGRGTLLDLSAAEAIGERATHVSGTPGFIAPETIDEGRADARSDLFAVGRTLELVLPRVRDVPASARAVCRRLLASDPRARPADAREVCALLAPDRAWRPSGAPLAPGDLVGREQELGVATDVVARFRRGLPGPRVLLLSGPPGIGKSRLLRELVWRAELELSVVEGSARRGLADLLQRAASSAELPRGVEAAFAARDSLARGDERVVLAIDDIDRLMGVDRELMRGLIGASSEDDRLLWLVTGRDSELASRALVQSLPLGPLAPAAIGAWVAARLSAVRLDDVMAATGGVPARLSQLASAIARGSLRESEVSRWSSETLIDAGRLRALPPSALAALALLSISDRIAEAELIRRGIAPADAVRLEQEGFVWLEPSGHYRVFDRQALLDKLPAAALSRAHEHRLREIAAERDGATRVRRSELAAEELACHLAVGQRECALSVIEAAALEIEHAPHAWLRSLAGFAERAASAPVWIALASAHDALGDAERALSCLAKALGARPESRLRSEIRLRAASAYERLGRVGRALAELARAEGEAPAERVAAVRARCHLRAGRYRESADLCRAHITAAQGQLAAELSETLGVSLGYLGVRDGAREHLERALELRGSDGSVRARVRTLSYGALEAYRAGETERAIAGFEQALSLAEQHALGDLLATSALNVGTARHQSGDWGGAKKAYERGLRAATAFGRERTAVTLRFNLAKLAADVGLHDVAAVALGELERRAGAYLGAELEAAVHGLRAEVALAGGDFAAARQLLARARELHQSRSSRRELAECELSAAELALAEADIERARAALAAAGSALGALSARDLELRAATIEGRIALASSAADRALECVRRGAALRAGVAQLELGAELDRLAADAYRHKGAPVLAERQRLSALECWERIGSSLPDDWIDAFWNHPRRKTLRRAPIAVADPGDTRFLLALRVLEINRRLSSTLDSDEILRVAMDAAIELTGAERGFVILRPPDVREKKLEIAVARNLDKERIGRGHLKLSRGVAKRVLETGEPVLSVDARDDERFSGNESVHALKLRSIVCVPIRAHGEVIGALYVDNRFQRARFGGEHAEVLAAFADQVAVALSNGRLVAEVRRKAEALEREQERVRALMQSQADEIERLNQELERERTRAEPERAYPEIVGKSEPIRRVLALLDKLVASDVPVLVSGESGTGKELVARAIHFGGPRQQAPFVAINCAALPEPLLESELFGHVKGAFTGAVRDHAGLFLSARGGTLFLDEIGELSREMQAKLLRALQEREIRPVGSDAVIAVGDVRVVAATNRRLRDEIELGRFREDLYYRLSVVELELPPLRDRPEDIPLIARAILDRIITTTADSHPLELSRAALAKLAAHAWPGNVRQLENVLARAAVLADGARIEAKDLELPALGRVVRPSRTRADYAKNDADRIRRALDHHRWNVCEVSRALGIPRTTLYRKLRRYGLLDERA